MSTINELYLAPMNLTICPIAADGNCLYRAIAHQLAISSPSTENIDHREIRKTCAESLRENQEEYAPFCDLEEHKVNSFHEYVEKCVGDPNSSEWGGHLELRALAKGLDKTIIVYSAESAPLIIHGDDHTTESHTDDNVNTLKLSFHKHYYALGEHYNSVVKK